LKLRLAGTGVTPAGVERFKKQHLAIAGEKIKSSNLELKGKLMETRVELK
jgi:hypothetical protein